VVLADVVWAGVRGSRASVRVVDQPTLVFVGDELGLVVEVRGANAWAAGHLPGAIHIPLGYLAERCRNLPKTTPLVTQCETGGLSAIAASLLQRFGFQNVINLTGGYSAWRAAGLPVEGSHGNQATHA